MSSDSIDSRATVQALRGAIPYLRLFQGKVFVIKAGGEVFDDAGRAGRLVEEVGVLHRLGIGVVLVHGGGPQIAIEAERMGLPERKIAGRRVTDEGTLQAAVRVLNGTLRTRILSACRAAGLRAVGLSGIDGAMIRARRRPQRPTADGGSVDFGFVGDVVEINPAVPEVLLEAGIMPIVSPLAADDAGVVLNVNADVVASHLAASLGAAKLILMTGAPGILADPDDPGSLVPYADLKELRRLEERGALAGGMLPKVESIRRALFAGVPRVHVISHRRPDSLLMEVFTNVGSGTLLVHDMGELLPDEVRPPTRVERILDLGREAEHEAP